MSEAAILWLFGTLITLVTLALGAVAALLLKHMDQCKDVHKQLSKIDAAVERIRDDIGDTDSGMRGAIHEHGRGIHYHGLCVWLIADKLGIQLPEREKKK